MFIIIGFCKGEVFVIGHTSSRKRAERWVANHPNGEQDEYDYVEFQSSATI